MMYARGMRNWSSVGLLWLLMLPACRKPAGPAATQSSTANDSGSEEKRYHLEGQVVSTDNQSKMVNVDSQAIPGFMDAMTMPYVVKPERELDHLSPGDHITGDVVVRGGSVWLEKIVVTSHSAKPASK
jgi:protein SCO1/2